LANSLLLSVAKAVRRRARRLLRLRPPDEATPEQRTAAKRARLTRDLRRLKVLAAARPDLRIQITCAGKVDGVGAQAAAVMSALAFAEANNCTYLHTPFRSIAHAEGDGAAWTRRWESFLALGQGEMAMPGDALPVPIRRYVRERRRYPHRRHDARIVVQSPLFFGPGVLDADGFYRLKTRLRAKYFSTDKSTIPVFRAPGRVTVAVHARRGDLPATTPRYFSDQANLDSIALLCAELRSLGREPSLHLFSEGPPDLFEAYREAGCELHLGVDAFTTLHNLITADILVGAQSGFSHIAGLISDGIVIDPWSDGSRSVASIHRAMDGGFDRAQLAAALKTRL